MVGFGFIDNFFMLIAGDAIDESFGATLVISTMAAAALGNWVSDMLGLGLSNSIEVCAWSCERKRVLEPKVDF